MSLMNSGMGNNEFLIFYAVKLRQHLSRPSKLQSQLTGKVMFFISFSALLFARNLAI